MTARALPWPKLGRGTILRGVTAGTAWGLIVATALLALSFHQCGTICLGQMVETTALSITAGILAIGPLVLLRRTAKIRAA
jgi:hypothetical protein